jgi:4-alpha-glucanotransferase
MRKYGVLSTRFMLFERDENGAFRAPSRYPREALATFANHDVVPLAGWMRGRDSAVACALRSDGGEATSRPHVAHVAPKSPRSKPRSANTGISSKTTIRSPRRRGFLAATPCALIALSFEDLAGETTPVNIPTATNAVYPCWSRRMRHTVEQITADPRFIRIITDVVARRRSVTRPGTSGTA